MLGCVGVAPGPGDAPVATQDSGCLGGGNMDFNGIAEATTVLFRVHQPGALVYPGDAHALQGDGELNGNALETSMDVDLSADACRRVGDHWLKSTVAIANENTNHACIRVASIPTRNHDVGFAVVVDVGDHNTLTDRPA
jgi:acetamidase/formamidase